MVVLLRAENVLRVTLAAQALCKNHATRRLRRASLHFRDPLDPDLSVRIGVSARPGSSQAKRFEALLREHFDALYAAARRMTLLPSDAEDLVQDVCIKAFVRFDEFEAIEHKRAWLLKVLYHRFIDRQRANQRSPVDLADTGAESIDPEQMSGSDWQPDRLADSDLRAARILRAMQCLSGDQCMLVALRDIEELSIAELASLTGMKDGTIKAQLHRTRAKLGRLLTNDALSRPQLKVIGD